MNVKTVEKKIKLTVEETVKFQLITALIFFREMVLTSTEISILTHLVITRETDLSSFCTSAVKKMYKIERPEEFAIKSQNIRNIINKLAKKNLIVKSKDIGKKSIQLNPEIKIYFKGSILLNYQFLSIYGN